MNAAVDVSRGERGSTLRIASLWFGIVAALTALSSFQLARIIQGYPLSAGFTLVDNGLSDTKTYLWIWMIYSALGIGASALAVAAYVKGGLGRAGKAGLALGILAVGWTYVVQAFVIVMVVLIFLAFAASGIGS